MLVTDRQSADEFVYEFFQLIIRQAESFLDHLKHYVNDELKRMPEGNVRQFIDHEKEEFADCPIITAVPLLKR